MSRRERPPVRRPCERRGHESGEYQLGGLKAGKYRIWVEAGNLNDPLALVATLAHELGRVDLLGAGRVSPDTEDHEPLTDLLTVFFGLGVITANAVIRENYWSAGAFSGWSMGRCRRSRPSGPGTS